MTEFLKKNKQKINILIIVLIIISILEIIISGALSLAKYNDSIALLCGENPSNSCNTVQNSDFSNIIEIKSDSGNDLKVSFTFMGLIFYLIFTYFLIKFYYDVKLFEKRKKIKKNFRNYFKKLNIVILVFGAIAFIMSIIYTLIQAFLIKAYCKYCLFSAFNSTILFLIILYVYFKLKDEI